MRRVLKYPLSFGGQNYVGTSHDAKVVMFDMQHGEPHVWIESDSYIDYQHMFVIIGTGHDIPHGGVHVASCKHDEAGSFIWHLYKLKH